MRRRRTVGTAALLALLAPLASFGAPEGTEEEILNDDFDSGTTCLWSAHQPFEPPLISEIVVQPTAGEFIEIYNPVPPAVDLEQYWLADYAAYYLVTTGAGAPDSTDFRVHFPASFSLACGARFVVALESSTLWIPVYNIFPTFVVTTEADVSAPKMIGEIGTSAGVSNVNEVVVLFRWDGASDLVEDADYVVWGDTSDWIDKTGVTVGESTYLPETAAASQVVAPAHALNQAIHRCDLRETTETPSGSNGITGADETSENLALAFVVGVPSPGAPPPVGACPSAEDPLRVD